MSMAGCSAAEVFTAEVPPVVLIFPRQMVGVVSSTWGIRDKPGAVSGAAQNWQVTELCVLLFGPRFFVACFKCILLSV